jgi:hypothetical protein
VSLFIVWEQVKQRKLAKVQMQTAQPELRRYTVRFKKYLQQ